MPRPRHDTVVTMLRLRRALLVAAAATLALAASSAASGVVKHRFTAPLQGGVNNAGLELDAYYKNKVPKYITNLTWENVSCPSGGFIPFTGVQHWSASVNGKLKFNKTHAVQKGPKGETVKITGKFTKVSKHKYTLAGTFALSGVSSCSGGTGKLKYKTG
jgi:hypothetical protein